MIFTETKPYGLIKTQFKKQSKIGIVACNACAKICETGGEGKMEELAKRLKDDGFLVVDKDLIPMACDIDLVKKPEYKGDTLIVLACDAGIFSLKKLFPKNKIIAGLDTVGLGARDEKGDIFLVQKFKS